MSGVVLAAGASRRFGSTKQLAEVEGQSLVRLVVDRACRSRLDEVVVIVGHDRQAVGAALHGLAIRLVENAAYAQGQSTSVRAGVDAVATRSRGAMFIPADQPGLTTELLDRLVAAFELRPDAVVVPVYGGRPGSPVTFPRDLFPALRALQGDAGGRVLLPGLVERIVRVEFETAAPLADIDTPEDWDHWRRTNN